MYIAMRMHTPVQISFYHFRHLVNMYIIYLISQLLVWTWCRRNKIADLTVFTLSEHLSSPSVFSGVLVTRSLVWCVRFVDRCLSFCTFSFGHCMVCSSICGLWLPIWFLQILLIIIGYYTIWPCSLKYLFK